MDKSILSNPAILNINRLDARCSIVPAQRKGIIYQNKFESDFLVPLNGDYRFIYFDDDVFDDYYAVDVDDSSWDTLAVPAVWEYNGYGLPVYPNVEYPFPFDPPYIDIKKPIGCYRRHFTVDEIPQSSIIHFDGVDNCFEFYINGSFAGFSKNCRIATEFDITDLLKKGDNLLAIKVYKYSDASYLENQDMLLASGITRDIYLINTGLESVLNYTAEANTTELHSKIYFSPKGNYEACTVRAILDGVEQRSKILGNFAEFTFKPENVRLWNAETPNLYDYFIILEKDGREIEIHSKRVGFRECHIGDKHIYVNGTPITLKGINRHEYNAKTGRYITVEQIRHELEIIKGCHINAIRQSHYPDHPATYEIAAELGIYLFDEADIETHGCGATGDQGFISKLPQWENAYIDRLSRMVERDKNETAVICWSIGNECGKGENIEKCSRWLRKLEFPKPVLSSQGGLTKETVDFLQAGYCKVSRLEEFPDDDMRPAILTEYAHSMGNSPGALWDYWNKIYHTDRIAGGFGWEFKSHGFYTEDSDGNEAYLYGGDFGDINSWSNFTLDGFMFSDITKKPAMYELSEVHAPAWIDYTDGEVFIMNTNDFLNLNAWQVEYKILEDYKPVFSGRRQMESVLPHESVRFDDWKAFTPTADGAKYYLDLSFYDASGELDAHKQILLRDYTAKAPFGAKVCDYEVSQTGRTVTLSDRRRKIVFEDGMLCRYEADGNVILNDKVKINVFRAPTDNDGIVNLYPRHISEWQAVLLDDFMFGCRETTIEKTDTCVKIKATGKILPHGKFVGFTAEIEYTVYAGGIILTSITAEPYGNMPPVLPRFGLVYTLNGEYVNAEWYGRGPGENYIDRCVSTPVGLYKADIKYMNTFYDVPQENGNRCNVGFVTVTNSNKQGFTVIGSDEFEFSFHDFTLENLTKARHKNELKKSEKNYLYVDYKMRGVGSRSCGPDPEDWYEFFPHSFRFAHIFAPTVNTNEALSLLRSEFPQKTEKLTERYVKTEPKKIVQLFECKE